MPSSNRRTIFIVTIISIAALLCIPLFSILYLSRHANVTSDSSKNMLTKTAMGHKYKILHVMSYHSPWEWTDKQFEGFKTALKDLNIEYKVFQMDTKQNSSENHKIQAGAAARALIEQWKPDLVYTSDDDAQIYVTKYYINQKTPFIFSAVNADPKIYGFTGSKNISGSLEQEHFAESVNLLKQIVPSVKKIVVVLDNDQMWVPVLKRIKEKQSQFPTISFSDIEIIHTFADYKKRIIAYPRKYDAIALIGIFSFKDESGKNVPYQEVLKWTEANSKLPDFSLWKDRVSYGTLCAVSVSAFEQGLAAGKIALAVLKDGKKPSDFKMVPTLKGEPFINLARAKRLGIKVNSSVILNSQVITKYIWEK